MSYTLTRRNFFATATALSVSSSCTSGGPGQTEGPARPNIVLLMGDDHGWHETGYNGHSHVKTPVLDEMAASGLRLDRFYSAAPVCSPTRGSVMTGRHPNRYGTFSANWSIRPEETGIAQMLSQAGYACGHFGKWHLGPVKADSPTNPGAFGFDEWLSHDNFFEMNPILSRNGAAPEMHEGESSQIVIDAAKQFIDKAKRDGRPFFAVIWFGSPHEPYSGLDSDLQAYADLPESLREGTAGITSMETGLRTQVRLDKILQARYAEITAMDRAIGDLREHLREADLRPDTLLWYCSDNGAPSEAHFSSSLRSSKGRVYEGGVRVPCVIEWPARIPEPLRSPVNSVTSDILPTLCELTGQSLPDRPLDGLSLVPVIDGAMQQRPEPICFWRFEAGQADGGEPYIDAALQEGTTPLVKYMDGRLTRNFRNFHHPSVEEADFSGPRAVLDHRYKLVVDGGGAGTRELFDIRADPAESNDLADRHPEEVARLEAHLHEWQESVLHSLSGGDYS
ncbi:MAG: sulfatase-like hydrolase/transferase [Bryobacterales bacterium]|nr:sulfatase-like hydrolase/transferase [Bryobacterales bacterium]